MHQVHALIENVLFQNIFSGSKYSPTYLNRSRFFHFFTTYTIQFFLLISQDPSANASFITPFSIFEGMKITIKSSKYVETNDSLGINSSSPSYILCIISFLDIQSIYLYGNITQYQDAITIFSPFKVISA